MISSLIRQKGESQNGCFKKTKHVKFSGKFGLLCFHETLVLIFVLLPYYRRCKVNNDVRVSEEIHGLVRNIVRLREKPLQKWEKPVNHNHEKLFKWIAWLDISQFLSVKQYWRYMKILASVSTAVPCISGK